MMALSKREREDFIRGLTIGVICALIGCAFAIALSGWDVTSKALGIIVTILLSYISYNEFDKHLMKKPRSK
jgi:uncharacterized protein YacL